MKALHDCLLVCSGVLLACLLAGGASPVAAQQQAVRTDGLISGQVVDAQSGTLLAGALITLSRIELFAAAASPDALPGPEPRNTVTGADGEYLFEKLSPGVYEVAVHRLGYLPSTVQVMLRSAAGSRMSVGLEVKPIALEPLNIRGSASPPFVRSGPAASSGEARNTTVRQRQQDHLVGDVRQLTRADVEEAVTLGETDVFRALQRAPGVASRDDYTSFLWTRGAPWAHTRVYFDGMPLFNPTHSGWLFSAINPAGVGSAVLHAGVRPARWGDGAAAVLDVESRPGGRDGALSGSGELSFATVRLAMDGELPLRGGGWMVTGRRTHLDWATRALERFGNRDSIYVPYDFSDLMARIDLPLGRGWEVTASGLREEDRLRGDVPGVFGNEARRGNDSGRLSFRVPLGPLESSVSWGGTDATTRVWVRTVDGGLVGSGSEAQEGGPLVAATLPALRNRIRHSQLGFRLGSPAGAAGAFTWSAGIQRQINAVEYDGPASFTAERFRGFSQDSAVGASVYRFSGDLRHTSVWAEGRTSLGRFDLEGGLRLDTGDPVRGPAEDQVQEQTESRLAPNLMVRYRADEQTSFSAAWGRSFQYTQDVGAQAGPLGPQLHLTHLWIVAGEIFPLIRADIVTAGAERWLGANWLLSVNGYYRAADGLRYPNPTPRPLQQENAALFNAQNEARGAEISARRLAGRWTGSVGYSYGVSDFIVRDERFPSPADVRHTLDLGGSVRVRRGVRLNAAYTLMSGIPYTRVVVPIQGEPYLEEPNAARSPVYANLNVALELHKRFGGVEVGAYAQVYNVLNRSNAVTYAGTYELCTVGGDPALPGLCPGPSREDDRFDSGLGTLPLFGVRLAF